MSSLLDDDLLITSDEDDDSPLCSPLSSSEDSSSGDSSSSDSTSSSSSSCSSSSSFERHKRKVLTKRTKKRNGARANEDEYDEELDKKLELLMMQDDDALSCPSDSDDGDIHPVAPRTAYKSPARGVPTGLSCNKAAGTSSSSNNYEEDHPTPPAPYTTPRRPASHQAAALISASSSDEDGEAGDYIMRSVSDEEMSAEEEADSDFDPDDMLKPKEDYSDTASVASTASSTATWNSILSSGPPAKRRRLDADGQYVRVSQTKMKINAIKDEFSLSLGSAPSALSFSVLTTRSSEIAAEILKRASKKHTLQQQRKNTGEVNGRPNITDMPPPAALNSKRVTNASNSRLPKDRYGYKPHIPPNIEFADEIKTVITTYLSLVFLQRAMNNTNNNSSGYYGDMVDKMIDIINNIPREEMTHEKYQSTVKDALYMYCIVVSKLTGPEHLKRLRTPKLHSCFCYLIAMMANNLPIDSDLTLANKSTNLVQFASGMSDPAYRTAIHNLSNVFNNSYSVMKALDLPPRYFMMVNQILAILSTKNTPLFERKPRTLAQSAYLYFDPSLRDPLISSGLPREQNSLGAAVKLVAKQFGHTCANWESLEDGLYMLEGRFESEGVTLKSLGGGQKDIKIVGISTVLTEMLRQEVFTVAIT